MKSEHGPVREGRSRQQARYSQPTIKLGQGFEDHGGNHGCHEKINSILKKVLKKLKMSQAVENKAYEMVEEMMMEREMDMIDSDEY